MRNKTILITQARLGSTRLPKKILYEINGKSLLEIQIERLKKCQEVSEIIVATTDKYEDKIIYDKAIDLGVKSFMGSEHDVLERFYNAAKNNSASWVIRITSDCPLIDPKLVDAVINLTKSKDMDYGSNTLIEDFPDGQDVEVFKFSALEYARNNAKLTSEREHVTPYLRKYSTFNHSDIFTAVNYSCEGHFNKIRMTVDELSDINTIEILINELGIDATWQDYAKFIINNPEKFHNQEIIRNEGYFKSLNKD